MTKDVMSGLGISNWSTVTRTLQKLEKARLVSVNEANVGLHKSRAKFWRVEPQFGTKVASALEEAERNVEEASAHGIRQNGRPAILDIESPTAKLVILVENAVKTAVGNK